MNLNYKNFFLSLILLTTIQSNLIAQNTETIKSEIEQIEEINTENKKNKFESPKLEKLSKILGIAEIIETIAEIMIDHNTNPGSRSIRRDDQKQNLKQIKLATNLSNEIINATLEKKSDALIVLIQLITEEYQKENDPVTKHGRGQNIFQQNVISNSPQLNVLYYTTIKWFYSILFTIISEEIISKFNNRIHRRILRTIIYSFGPILTYSLFTQLRLISKEKLQEEFLNLNLVNTLIRNALTETAGEILLQELENVQIDINSVEVKDTLSVLKKMLTESKENISLAN
ncbi:MAG: hypothetical protein ABIA74_06360 [bacterium]